MNNIKNRLLKLDAYNLVLVLMTFISAVLIALPLFMLVVRGAAYVPEAIVSEEAVFSIKLSMRTTIISTLIVMLVAFPTSLILSSGHSKFKRIIELILYIPMSLPHLVAGIALLYFFGQTPIGKFISKSLNMKFIFTVQGIIMAQVFVNLPYTIKHLVDFSNKLDNEYFMVARSLGASEWQIFKYITLPLMRRDLLSTTLMTWYRGLGEFGAVMMLVGTTRLKTEIIPTAIFLNMSTGDLNTAIALSIVLIGIAAVIMTLYHFVDRRSEI